MAQYFDDWAGSTLDSFPTGWTRRFGEPTANQWAVREVGGVRYLEVGRTTYGSTLRQMISLNAVDSDANREDFEVVFKWQCASVGSSRPQLKGAGRASGDATATNCYLGGFDNSGGGHRAQKYVAGTSSTIVASADTVLAATDYITRFRVSGTAIKLRTWLASESEPATWNVETTDAALTADGWVGLFCLNTTYVYKVAFVGIATGTDTAPMTTPPSTPEEPVDPPSGSLALVTTGDSFNAHPTNSSVVDAATSTPTVNIVVRVVYTGWRQFLFKVTGALSRRPIFKIDPTGFVNVFTASWRPWYSYDGINWLRFDTAPVNNVTTWDFQHSAAFTGDNVWVAYQPAWQVSRVPWLIGQLQALNPSLVHELPSAPSFEYATALTAQTDELGTAVPSQKMHALGIWDNTLNPLDGSAKRIAIITGNVHAGEHIGAWPMEGFLRYLFSGTAKAITLLRNIKFYIYPMLNPMGRYMGHYRGQRDPAGITLDPNRDYPVDGSASTLQSSTFYRSMLATDMGANAAAFSLDFHATWGSAGSYYFYSDPTVDPYAAYLDEWHARIQSYSTGYSRNASVLETTVDQHNTRVGTQNHSYVVEVYESSAFPGGTADITLIGEHYAQALADSPLSEMMLSGLSTVDYPAISATTAASSSSAVSAAVTTDTAGGVIYGLLNSSSVALSEATIVAGYDDFATVASAGAYSLGKAGLNADTLYYWHIVHEDSDGLMSNVVVASVRTQVAVVSGTPVWPASLPAPLVDGYGIEPVDQTVATDMEVGTQRVRRRSFAQVDTVRFAVNMSDAQMATFRAWLYNPSEADGGAGWFNISLWVGKTGASAVEGRFKGIPKWDMTGNHRWLVSGQLEVRHA